MSAEADLVRQLRTVLGARQVDVEELVDGAWEDARTEVRAVLTRAMANDLLERALAVLGEDPRPPSGAPRQPDVEAPPVAAPAPDPVGQAAPEQAPTDDRGTGPSPAAPVVYVFGITDRAPDPSALAGARQLPGGGPIRVIEGAELVAVVCDLEADVLTSLRADTPEALETLTHAALAHDEVLAKLAGERTVIPLRLGTVVADDRAAGEVIDRHTDRFRAELDRVAGHAEWAVTVREVSDGQAGGRQPGPAEAAGPPGPRPGGREHLERRRRELEAREQRRCARTGAATAIHERLGRHASEVGTTEGPPGSDGASTTLHGVYLVAFPRTDAFLADVEALRREHGEVVVEVSGPLPPYHFVAPAGALDGSVPS